MQNTSDPFDTTGPDAITGAVRNVGSSEEPSVRVIRAAGAEPRASNPPIALVTGAASGLGRATVDRLCSAGWRAVGIDIADAPGSWNAPTGAVTYVKADVTDEDAIRGAFEIGADLGGVRAVVNCAGVAPAQSLTGRRGTHPADLFRRTVDINLAGTFNVLAAAATHMSGLDEKDGERGVIILTASIAGYEGQRGQIAYAASKAGVIGMVLPAARDLAKHRIRVVGIAPGLFETPLLLDLPEAARGKLATDIPHPTRLGRPREFADLALGIIGSPYLNGTVIRVDGALRMA